MEVLGTLALVLLVLDSTMTAGQSTGRFQTSCSESRRQWDLASCLDTLGKKSEDPQLFWFGQRYSMACTAADTFTAECFNPRPDKADSLVTRLFPKGFFRPKQLDRFLDVTYTTKPGEFYACGNTYRTHASRTIHIDPLVTDVFRPWELRELPRLAWRHDSGVLYTLIFFDPGYFRLKGFYINIAGNDLNKAEEILKYEGPLNPTRNQNPYVFALFEQKAEVYLTPWWRQQLYQRTQEFDFQEFATSFSLKGPIALTWMRVSGDPYAAEIKRERGYMNTCPYFVTEAFRTLPVQFFPQATADSYALDSEMTTFVNVTYHSPPVAFNSCCSFYELPERTVVVNPIGNGQVKAAYSRNEVEPVIDLSMATAFPSQSRDFKDKLMALIMVDPDVPLPEFGTPNLPFVHWLVVNIRDGDVSTGDVVHRYMGPAPPDPLPHTYYFLVFEQKFQVAGNDVMEYAAPNCSVQFKGRCRFELSALITDAELTLMGASWMVTSNDEFVRHLYINAGQPSCVVCKDLPAYGIPCPYLLAAASGRSPTPAAFLVVVAHVTVTSLALVMSAWR